MAANEFSPSEYFSRLMKSWWIVLTASILGGLFGYVFFHLHPPVYEATATFFVTIDINQFPIQGVREDLIQYNEDMALSTTEGVLRSPDVINKLISQLKPAGITITGADTYKSGLIERKNDVWEVSYQSTDPLTAQTIVNTWVKIGYQAMLVWQQTGKAPKFIIFQPPTEASLPQEPVLYGRNNVILAGLLIGFIAGIITAALLRYPNEARVARPSGTE